MFNQRPAQKSTQLKSQSFSFVRLAQQAANKHQRNRVPQEYAEIEESEAQELKPVKNKDTLSRERGPEILKQPKEREIFWATFYAVSRFRAVEQTKEDGESISINIF